MKDKTSFMSIETRGMVFNIQRYSVQDGPGIRTTVFLKGCPLRCAWCSNPESQASFPEIGLVSKLCNSCGRCKKVCPVDAISIEGNDIKIDRDACIKCGECINECPPRALKLWGTEMSVNEVFEVVSRDRGFYRNSGGGVTLSGGEPLAQPHFAISLLQICAERGIHTCVDTSGFCDPHVIHEISEYVDLFLCDLKLMDTEKHEQYTGAPNQQILDNAILIARKGIPMIIRVALIPGINDSDQNIRSTASFVRKSLKRVNQVDLLPYHRFGVNKYGMLANRPYALARVASPSKENIERARQIIAHEFKFKCQIGG